MMRGLLIGEALLGRSRRPARVLDGGVGVAGRSALTVMIGDLGIGLPRLAKPTDRFGNDAMQTPARSRRQSVVERLANEGVAETVATCGASHLMDEFERFSLVE